MSDVMPKPCANCPFARGKFRGLRPGRLTGIVASDGEFICHKTGSTTGDGSHKVCAGWAGFCWKLGVGGQMFRIMGRLGALDHVVDAPWLGELYDDLNEAEEAMRE